MDDSMDHGGFQENLDMEQRRYYEQQEMVRVDNIVRNRLAQILEEDGPNMANEIWDTLSHGFHRFVQIVDQHEEGFLCHLLLIACLAMVALFLMLPCVASRLWSCCSGVCNTLCCRTYARVPQRTPANVTV